jgi:uncharacterized protein YndB with AHSA1/START domain
VTASRRGSARAEFPNELDVLVTREFDAPIALVFDVLTKPEHASKWGAYPSEPMTECSIDLRVGGTTTRPGTARNRRSDDADDEAGVP